MAGERGRLTDLQIRHWVRAGVPMAKADGGGLTFTLSACGAACWVLRYSHGGRRRELTIGRYPDIVAYDHGEALAREAARQLVVERRRPGGQSQFSPLLDLQRPEGRFGALLDQVRSRLHDDHSVDALAASACMSPRHFARCFHAETGATPAQAVERMRVEAARTALQSGQPSVQRIAEECGFGNAERMRRSFQRLLGRPPRGVSPAG